MDLILSSGFLAFARHLGAIDATLQCGAQLDALVGTSSGALVGVLFQAGLSPDAVAQLLSEMPPIRYMRLNRRPWQGLFSLQSLIPLLERYLPRTFEGLARPFAVGVRDDSGRHRLVHSGDLMSAVMASIAIPRVFPAVLRDDQRLSDGGMADRTGVSAWRVWRPHCRAIVHVVDRTHGSDVPFDQTDVNVVRSPRSGAKFWSLGDFAGQRTEAKTLILGQLRPATGS